MSSLGANCILVIVLLACLFIPGRTQLPHWFEQLGNLNGSLSGLQMNANTTIAELVKQLNSTADWQKVLTGTALGGENADFSSYFSPARLDNLGKCGDDLRRVMNNSDVMLQCESLAVYRRNIFSLLNITLHYMHYIHIIAVRVHGVVDTVILSAVSSFWWM